MTQELEAAMLRAVVESPDDLTPWHALHDLLLERDDPRIDFVRLQLALRGVLALEGPAREELDDRVRGLLLEGHQPLAPVLANSVGMRFALIPAGAFRMGSPEDESGRYDDEEQHEVEITRPFFLGVHVVTQAQYQRVMGGANPSHFSADGPGSAAVAGLDTGDFPVERVSWNEAVEFCRRLSDLPEERAQGRAYRLPTDAEWELACRGGASSHRPFHYGGALTVRLANFDSDYPYPEEGADLAAGEGPHRTSAVGTYPPNAFGLYDMHGNVEEWCSDWFDDDYYDPSPKRDPTGPEEGERRVLRGGSWQYDGEDCRTAFRESVLPEERYNDVGIRVVLEVTITSDIAEGQQGANLEGE